MACDTPLTVIKAGETRSGKYYEHDVNVGCGKCPPCKTRRVREWIFRLEEEERHSSSSLFITLTYNNKNVPITKGRYPMTLKKKDLQDFFKRLRHYEPYGKIKYYAAGEYGGKTMRPHYHIILFNVQDQENINKAWTLGHIDFGSATGASMAYTTKYIDKEKRIPINAQDKRVKEFSLTSQGLGKQFISNQMVRHYQQNPDKYYVTRADNTKVPMPRYYRNRIYTEEQRMAQTIYIQETLQEQERLNKIKFKYLKYPKKYTYEQHKQQQKRGRYNLFYRQQQDTRQTI